MDIPSAFTGGGAAGIVIALAYAGRQVLEWIRERRKAPLSKASATVTDAATANATLVTTLEAITKENVRQARKIKHLEDEAAAKDRTIRDLGEKLDAAQTQIHEIAAELATLKTR